MITTNLLSADTLELIAEWHASQPGLDTITTEAALVHDAIHAYTGLGVSLADEEIVLNISNLLAGLDCLPHNRERCEFIISLLPSDVLVELSIACVTYYG